MSFDLMSPDAWIAFFKVVMIDLVLAGDNAVVIGLAAAGLPKEQRNKAILAGIVAATIMRIGFATIAVQLLKVVGLIFVGGLLLLWVCWKMWRELRESRAAQDAAEQLAASDLHANGSTSSQNSKSFRQAAMQIFVADISMSLDNVLAVAGAAREHPYVLVVGLALSVALMGLAAAFIAKMLGRSPWIAYVGLAIIFYVALEMIYRGGLEMWPHVLG